MYHKTMKQLLTFMCCMLAFSLSSQAQKKKKNDDLHITGGLQVAITEVPYHVNIQSNGNHRSGGVIINDRFVLTSAHSVWWDSANDLTVVAGTNLRNGQGANRQQFNVVRIIRHPSRDGNFDYDYALIEISGRFTFNNFVQPIELIRAAGNSAEAIGNTVKVSGWGWTVPDIAAGSNTLQAVNVSIISNTTADTQLNTSFPGHPPITSRMIATDGASNTNRLGVCHGDEGGPLVYKQPGQPDVLVGITSWHTIRCLGGANSPSFYSRVSSVRDWIIANTWSLQGNTSPCVNTNTTYTLNTTNPGITTTWQRSSNVQIISSNNQSVTVRVNFYSLGSTWVRAVMSNGVTVQKTIVPPTFSISPFIQWENSATGVSSFLCSARTGNKYTFTASGTVQHHQYRIKNSSGQILYTSSAFLTGNSGYLPDLFFPEGIYRFEIRGTNTCGILSSWTVVYVEFKSCFGLGGGGGGIGPAFGEVAPDFTIFPNPVNMGNSVNFLDKQAQQTELTVKANGQLRNVNETTNITVYNMQQQKVFSTTFRGQERKLDLSRLKTGVYHMRIQKGNKVEIKKILVR